MYTIQTQARQTAWTHAYFAGLLLVGHLASACTRASITAPTSTQEAIYRPAVRVMTQAEHLDITAIATIDQRATSSGWRVEVTAPGFSAQVYEDRVTGPAEVWTFYLEVLR